MSTAVIELKFYERRSLLLSSRYRSLDRLVAVTKARTNDDSRAGRAPAKRRERSATAANAAEKASPVGAIWMA